MKNLLGGFWLGPIIDKDFQSLIPPLATGEYNLLEESILKEGCRDPLILWNEILIDGHNRYAICKKHNIEFNVRERPFNSRNDVSIWIIQNQFGRRNLTYFARAELGLKLKHFFQEKVRDNLKTAGKVYGVNNLKNHQPCQNSDNPGIDKEVTLIPVDTKKKVAKIADVSHDTISKVEKILGIASPEEIEKARTGEVSVHQMYSTIKRKEKEDQRDQHVNENIEKIKNGKTMGEIDGLFQTIVMIHLGIGEMRTTIINLEEQNQIMQPCHLKNY
jgi:hypothetical protein